MIKAMLVDDEVLMIKMLEALIDWNRLGIEIVATACDGVDAMEKYVKFLPQIVISDIKMPKLSGLEFISRVHAMNAEAEFIFISAYADFGYVSEAMRLGVANYILKPIDEAELERTLRAVTDKINDKNLAIKKSEKNDRFKAKILLRDYMKTGQRAGAAAKVFGELVGDATPFVLLSVTPNAETINEYTELAGMADHHLNYLLDKMQEIIRRDFNCLSFEYEERSWMIILFCDDVEKIARISNSLLKFLKDECKINARAAFSQPAGSMRELPRLYAQVNQYNKYAVANKRYSALVENGIAFLDEKYDTNLSLDEICEYLSVSKNYFSYLFKHDTGTSLWAYLTKLRIDKAKDFLESTDLKSYEIAYKVGYDNPSYFAKLFKKYVGKTPNEYRMEKR
ncbi:MAG: response regulator [Oscillospiraceae bacterium]|nr:response regulator [Oscillospiraceae bacterium]